MEEKVCLLSKAEKYNNSDNFGSILSRLVSQIRKSRLFLSVIISEFMIRSLRRSSFSLQWGISIIFHTSEFLYVYMPVYSTAKVLGFELKTRSRRRELNPRPIDYESIALPG